MTPNEWREAVHNKEAWAYIRPNRRKHDSGWRCFEVGFITLKDNRVDDKLVLSTGSDHLYLSYDQTLIQKLSIPLNMDLTLDGYIRLWCRQGIIEWESYQFCVSSAELVFIPFPKETK